MAHIVPVPNLPAPVARGPVHAWRLTRLAVRDEFRSLPVRVRSLPWWLKFPLVIVLVAFAAAVATTTLPVSTVLLVMAGYAVLAAILTPVLVWLVYLALLADPRRRYYCWPTSEAPTAYLGTHATRTGWTIEGHTTAHPRSGRREGQALRDAILPALIKAADAHHVDVTTTAVTQAHADLYAKDAPDLLPSTHRTLTGGVPMRRRPAEAAAPRR